MAHLRRVGLLVVSLGLLLQPPVGAQGAADTDHPPRRDGFWFSLGIAYGRLDFACAGGTDGPWQEGPPAASCAQAGRDGTTGGFARIGYALTSQILLSLAVNGWRRVGMDEGGWLVGLSGSLYPFQRADAFVELGLGRSTFRHWHPDGPDEIGSGHGVFGGIGYDLRVAPNFSLGAALRLHYGSQGDVGFGGVLRFADGSKVTSRTDVRQTWAVLTFGLTFH